MLGITLASINAFLYVGMFYVWKRLPRDHIYTVTRRGSSTAVTCALSWYTVAKYHQYICSDSENGDECLSVRYFLGIRYQKLFLAFGTSVVLTAILFAGPVAFVFVSQEWPWRMKCDFHSWILLLRDTVIAPLSEEWVFRACSIALLSLDGWQANSIVALTPVLFGAAHLHHFLELKNLLGVDMQKALSIVCFQMLYTTVFGWFAAWLFVRTGHFVAPVGAHMFCNILGFPPLIRIFEDKRLCAATIAGVILFACLLGPLTQPQLFLREAKLLKGQI